MTYSNNYPKGSEWRKWDLHLHAPATKLSDNYKTTDGSDPLDTYCDEIEKSDVSAFGITDYFSADSFNSFIKRFNTKYPLSQKRFFFNLELRLNESVNRVLEEVNLHLIFNPSSLDKIGKFLSHLKVVKTGTNETPIMCSELTTTEDFQSATVTRASITEASNNAFGPKANRSDNFLVFTAANNDGLRPERGKKRKEDICDEIDKFSDGFFGGIQNINYYLEIDRLEDPEQAIAKKPVIAGSDSHSFEDLRKFLGKRIIEGKGDGNKEKIVKDITWIKADLTYEGLKQIVYEPEPGERVFIGTSKPDQKADYKVISKITFASSPEFPEEIVFNPNLCSIIGSRSSGKSALLAYTAHSVDARGIEKIILGPGEGAKYHWDKITTKYSITWANGKTNDESPGNVVYVSQSYLFDKSKDANEVKAKIEPVLFKTLPAFEKVYRQTISKIEGLNIEISNYINGWFSDSQSLKQVSEQLKLLGDKEAVNAQKKEIEERIQALKSSSELSGEDFELFGKVSASVLKLGSRLQEIDAELNVLSNVSAETGYFTSGKVSLAPSLAGLPPKLQATIRENVTKWELNVLNAQNSEVLEYKGNLSKERTEKSGEIALIHRENGALFEKHKKHSELDELIKMLSNYEDVLLKISELETNTSEIGKRLNEKENSIDITLENRKNLIVVLAEHMDAIEQTALTGLKFGIEYGLDEELDYLAQKLNKKEKSDFVEYGNLKFEEIRKKPSEFLKAIYAGEQKVISGIDPEKVVQEALQLTEKILFTAEMEADKIGGFSEPTMTHGKRALFALRLILAESQDTWPLLIDQPEDDLDSRSIYDEVVPFLKEKKRERQIIMVSHNANLVIGADSEQVIVANRHGDERKNSDGKQFNYCSGSLEFTLPYDEKSTDTLKSQGVCEHACSILDGGKIAFERRKNKYNIK